MNEETNTNRFIFSDDFYNQLNITPEEPKPSIFEPVKPYQPAPKTKVEETVKVEDTNLFTSQQPSFNINPEPKVEISQSEPDQTMNLYNFNYIEQESNKLASEKQESKPLSIFSSPISTENEKNEINREIQPLEQPKDEETVNIKAPEINNSINIEPQFNENINQESTPAIDIPAINDIMPDTNQVNNIEESKPLSSFTKTSEIEPKTSEIENTQSISNNYDLANELNVETGINKDLEQEILRSRIETEKPQIPVVTNNTDIWNRSTDEKTVYRATRSSTPIKSVWDDEPVRKQSSIEPQTKNNVELSSVLFTKPNIINLDELITEEDKIIINEVDYDENNNDSIIIKSNLLEELTLKEQQTGKISILAHYGDDFCARDYITNPAIGRKQEIKELNLILLTPEKSAILVGKPGIGKTSIVEGLAYQLQRNNVPDALKGYRIISVKTTSLLGTLPTGETRLQTLIDEIKDLDKIILFIDEIHMLMGATNESSLDFANMFKESLGRGSIKMIGATTTEEYERYILRDKAFVRRFQRVDVLEPNREQTIKILMGTLPKIEKNAGAVLKYTNYIQTEIMAFIVDITTEYKRVYGIGSRYPDICITLLSQAFSQAVFDNRKEVNILDIRNAIQNSKNIYQDVINKELVNFDTKFKKLIDEETTFK